MKSLEQPEELKVTLASKVGDKKVIAKGTINEVSLKRHMDIYEAEESFKAIQDTFNEVELKYAKKEATAEEYVQAHTDMANGITDLYIRFADIMIDFDSGMPDKDFFSSVDFEYTKLLRIRDFFLKGLRS